jgi:DNA repair exonuclease SbcCD nuclease subunit
LSEANFDLLASQVNKINPDFVLTGGDMIYTAKNVDEKRAAVLFDFLQKKTMAFKMPVYYTMGNHETVGILAESGMDTLHPMWGKGMYEKLYGKRFYSFTHSDWKFFVLDGIRVLGKERNYTQGVDSLQIDWLRKELLATDKDIPLVISIHTPLVNPHAIETSKSKLLSSNQELILSLFRDHNLRIVLEGHTHLYMNLLFDGIHYISGGSTAYSSNGNSNHKGFVLVTVTDNKESIEFIPSGAN